MALCVGFWYTLFMQAMEREFKWDASARGTFKRFEEALSAAVGPLPPAQDLQITDRYLDNAKEAFSQNKIALRIRYQDRRFEATLKTKTALQNGLACRMEETRRLEGLCRFPAALQKLQDMQVWHGIALQGLKVRFIIKNHRKTYTVRYRQAVCEAALDKYVIYASGRRLAKREIELELKNDAEKDFVVLIAFLNQQKGLTPCLKSKVASAEELLKK